MANKPLVLCILDGLGYSETKEYNAVYHAKTPTIDNLWNKYPHTLLHASGLDVGLPDGQMGNSEVGHMTIGLGRIVFQDLPRISMSIKENTLKEIEELKIIIKKLKHNGKRCHLWGLLSDGGIHSHIEHLFGIADILLENGIQLCVHACTDGRDTPPRSALRYITLFHEHFNGKLQISTIGGRYYYMDRDKRWERIKKAYDVMVCPINFYASAEEYISHCYEDDISDEFIPPIAIEGYDGIQDGDAFIAFNFRTDRVRQMLTALTDDAFSGFGRAGSLPKFSQIVGVTEYSSEFKNKIGVMFKKQEAKNSLGEIIAKNGLRQLRVAETEKYPHVTFFLNGGIEDPFESEERIMVASPKIDTYDLTPEMSARKITDAVMQKLNNNASDVYIINFANPDMVGHTGNFDAVVKSIECMDSCLRDIGNMVDKKNGCLIIAADHGNAETMFDNVNKQPHTAHTTNDVIFILAGNDFIDDQLAKSCGLSNIAPTILDILGINKPLEMTGNSLRKKN